MYYIAFGIQKKSYIKLTSWRVIFYDSERTDMKCFLHLTLKRDLVNVVWISSGKEFQILAPM